MDFQFLFFAIAVMRKMLENAANYCTDATVIWTPEQITGTRYRFTFSVADDN